MAFPNLRCASNDCELEIENLNPGDGILYHVQNPFNQVWYVTVLEPDRSTVRMSSSKAGRETAKNEVIDQYKQHHKNDVADHSLYYNPYMGSLIKMDI